MRDAVIVGIDAYRESPLQGCVNDANDVTECLSLSQYDFDCTKILDGAATRTRILKALSEKAFNGSGDTLLFFFAGHGAVVGGGAYLICTDGEPFDPGISLAHLAQLMESAAVKYRSVICILDCCHAGGAFTWVSGRPLGSHDIERELPTVNESRCVLAACRPEETAKELPSGRNGVFTTALVDGMLGSAVDFAGEVSLLELYAHVARTVDPAIQTPVFKGDIAGTVILGSGFEPRKGKPLAPEVSGALLSKGQRLIDDYYNLQQRELSDASYRLSSGARSCGRSLEPVVTWFQNTALDNAEITRSSEWRRLEEQVRNFQGTLADIKEGQATQFGRVVRHIGYGGYGHVWEVETNEGRRRALKVFNAGDLADRVKVQRFQNGYANMKTLEHPRIVRVHEISLAPFGFLMDLVDGGNLQEVVIDRESPERVLRLFIDICDTVQHAHARGVRHRDIKPQNILILTDYTSGVQTPYLTDFDLAYHDTNRSLTTNTGVGGFVHYAAPEQLHEPNTHAARADTVDIYSLAQLMFYIFVGRNPSGRDFKDNRRRLAQYLNDWVDDAAAEPLMEMYELCTRYKPAERPSSVLELVAFVAKAEAIILRASGKEDLEENEICRRFGHLLSGLGNYRSTDSTMETTSLSGQVDMILRLRNVTGTGTNSVAEFELELAVTGNIPVTALKSGGSARAAINARLDKMLKRFPNVRRRAGNSGMYTVYLDIKSIPTTLTGLAKMSEIVTTAVSGIEQW